MYSSWFPKFLSQTPCQLQDLGTRLQCGNDLCTSSSHSDIHEQNCCSCTTTALVSVFTAVFIGCGSVVIHIAVCVYQSKHRKKSVKVQANSTGNGDTTSIEVIYEEVQHKKEGGEVIKMEENQAYSPPPWMR